MPGRQTQVIECQLVCCEFHDGLCMGCKLERIDIGADGLCDMFEAHEGYGE